MSNLLKAGIVLAALITAAQSLQCWGCNIGFFDVCFNGRNVTCKDATWSCFRGETRFNRAGSLSLHSRGCLDSDLCERTIPYSILGIGYTRSFQCCTTNLCNGASSLQLPLTAALCAAVMSSLWSVWEM